MPIMKRVAVLAASLVLSFAVAAPAIQAKEAVKSPAKAGAKAKPKADGASKAKVAGACYNKTEFEAEQAIRFHTRLMVIGLTCQQLGGSYEGLYVRYKQFTLNHKTQIAGWESALISYYRKNAKGNPYHALDNLRTHLANEMSQHIAAVSANIYCTAHVPEIDAALAMSDADVQKVAYGDGVLRVAELPRCDVPVPVFPAGAAAIKAVR